jgi:hypothetical protein
MQCITVKKGAECAFMTRKGCNFNGGQCHQVVDKCEGCAKTVATETGTFCTVAPNPAAKWSRGHCNFATHVTRSNGTDNSKQKLNPLKASKRAAGSSKKK